MLTVLQIVSLIACLYIFVIAGFNLAIDPDKGLTLRGLQPLKDRDKRLRFVWFAIAILFPLALSFASLIDGNVTRVEYIPSDTTYIYVSPSGEMFRLPNR